MTNPSFSYVFRRENDKTDVIFQTFSTTEERFGEMVITELKPGGGNITVTEQNKREYVALVVPFVHHHHYSDLFHGQRSR